jgi:DNA mismatch repair ATPase MutL
MQDLSLHILDVVENSITAGAKNIRIGIREDLQNDLLIIEISDDGKGMDPEFAAKVLDPFVTTRRERRVGLGLSLLAEAARISNGHLTIASDIKGGTRVKAIFQHSHLDRKPLGDVGSTLKTLMAANPEIDFVYSHTKNARKFSVNTKDLKAQLKRQSLTSPDGLKILRNKLNDDFPEYQHGNPV